MFTFATDYYILVAVAATGTLQIAASLGRLDGLLFLKQPIPARLLGLVLIVGRVRLVLRRRGQEYQRLRRRA